MNSLPHDRFRAIGPKGTYHGVQLDVPLEPVLVIGVVEGEGVHEEPLHINFRTDFLADLPIQGDSEGFALFYLRTMINVSRLLI